MSSGSSHADASNDRQDDDKNNDNAISSNETRNATTRATDAALTQLIASVAQARSGSGDYGFSLPAGMTSRLDQNNNNSFIDRQTPLSSTPSATALSTSQPMSAFPGQGINTLPSQTIQGTHQNPGDVNALQTTAYLLSATANSMIQAYAQQQQQQQQQTHLQLLQQTPGNVASGDLIARLLTARTQPAQPMPLPAVFLANNNAPHVAPSVGQDVFQQVLGAYSAQMNLPASLLTPPPPPPAAAAASAARPSDSDSNPTLRSRHPMMTHRPPIPLVMEYDEQVLNEYQCLLRKQIELFENGPDDLKGKAQGRNTPVQIGQVGIRCRHCCHSIPRSARPKGSVYYSRTLGGMYQVAQNMAKVHFGQEKCRLIPSKVNQRLLELQRENRKASGGKEYWVHCLETVGIHEDGDILRFKPLGQLPNRKSDTRNIS